MLKDKFITIESGRDAGKVFKVTEMPVSRLEKWCARALIALFGADVPPDAASMAATSSAAALASGVLRGLSGLRWEQAEPLYDELLSQIARVPDPDRPNAVVPLRPGNLDAHVEDLGSILRLRGEALCLCFDFFEDGGGLISRLMEHLRPQDCATTSTFPAA